jgi:hypothetical protein
VFVLLHLIDEIELMIELIVHDLNLGLEQYYESVEVINQIIDEVRDHKTRMELFPLKEYNGLFL